MYVSYSWPRFPRRALKALQICSPRFLFQTARHPCAFQKATGSVLGSDRHDQAGPHSPAVCCFAIRTMPNITKATKNSQRQHTILWALSSAAAHISANEQPSQPPDNPPVAEVPRIPPHIQPAEDVKSGMQIPPERPPNSNPAR